MSALHITIRPASPEDIPSVNNIQKHYILNTVITFKIEPNSDEAALDNYNAIKEEGLPYIVAVHETNNEVVGYCYASSFRGGKPAYRHTLELSLFCQPESVRQGIGTLLLDRIVNVLRFPSEWKGYYDGTRLFDYPPRQLMAVMAVDIDGPGEGLKLRDWYQRFGFVERGRLKEVGWKKERWVDTVYLQLDLKQL